VAGSFIGEETVIPGEKCHKMKRIHSFDEGDQESRIVTDSISNCRRKTTKSHIVLCKSERH
jgi:hypothetical protein